MKETHERCFECARPAEWVRHTQFAGDHYYCDEHAKLERDFGTEIDGQFLWRKYATNTK